MCRNWRFKETEARRGASERVPVVSASVEDEEGLSYGFYRRSRALPGEQLLSPPARSLPIDAFNERKEYVAVRMRLTRVGSKKNPIYRVVVADSRSPRDGKFIEIVGRYNPQTEPSTIEFNEEKVRDWLGKGAQPSEQVSRLLKKQNLLG